MLVIVVRGGVDCYSCSVCGKVVGVVDGHAFDPDLEVSDQGLQHKATEDTHLPKDCICNHEEVIP